MSKRLLAGIRHSVNRAGQERGESGGEKSVTSAFKTMAIGVWDILIQVLIGGQKSVEVDAKIKDGFATEVRVYVSPEANPPDIDTDADLVLKANVVELLNPWRTDKRCISGRVLYADPDFHRVLVKFLGKSGIKVPPSRIEELLAEPPDPPLVAARARYFLDRVLEQFPMWEYLYKEVLLRGHDLYASATLSPDPWEHYLAHFSPGKIEGRIQPGLFVPVSEFAVDCADPDFRKQFAASLADPRLQQIDLSGLP
jgi:hypothetical protein